MLSLTTIPERDMQGIKHINDNFQAVKDEFNNIEDWQEVPFTPINGSKCFGHIFKRIQPKSNLTEWQFDLRFCLPSNNPGTYPFARISDEWSNNPAIVAINTSHGGNQNHVGLMKNISKQLTYYQENAGVQIGDCISINANFRDIGSDSANGM